MTVVTREPEWDDESRGRVLALAEYESTICPCGCGVPMEKAHDAKTAFKVDTFTCYAERALDKIRDEDKAAAANRPDGWDAGLHYYVTEHKMEVAEGGN